MADIFISYKSTRRSAVRYLSEVLAAHGYTVWFDYWLASGQDFGRQLEAEIRKAACCIVLWCNESVESRWVLEEAALAHDLGTLVPVRVEKIGLPLGFSRVETVDLTDWTGDPRNDGLHRLLREVADRLGPRTVDASKLNNCALSWQKAGAPTLIEWPKERALQVDEQNRFARAKQAEDLTIIQSATITPEGSDPYVEHNRPIARAILGAIVTEFLPKETKYRSRRLRRALVASRSDTIITRTENESDLRIWDGRTGDQDSSLDAEDLSALQLSPDGTRLLARSDDTYKILAIETGDIAAEFDVEEMESSNRTTIRWADDSCTIDFLNTDDGVASAYRWSAADGLTTLGHFDGIDESLELGTSLILGGGRYVLASERRYPLDHTIFLLDSHMGLLKKFSWQEEAFSAPRLTSADDGSMFCFFRKGSTTIFDSSSGQAIRSLNAGGYPVFIGNRSILVEVDDEVACVDIRSGRTLFRHDVGGSAGGRITAAALRGGTVIALLNHNDETLEFLNAATGEILESFDTECVGDLIPFGNGDLLLHNVWFQTRTKSLVYELS